MHTYFLLDSSLQLKIILNFSSAFVFALVQVPAPSLLLRHKSVKLFLVQPVTGEVGLVTLIAQKSATAVKKRGFENVFSQTVQSVTINFAVAPMRRTQKKVFVIHKFVQDVSTVTMKTMTQTTTIMMRKIMMKVTMMIKMRTMIMAIIMTRDSSLKILYI